MAPRFKRMLIAIALGVPLAALITPLPAAAHVTVNPSSLPGGGFAVLTFRMPNERDNAKTIQLEVTLPAEQPLTSVRVKAQPGWTYAMQKAKLDKPIKSGDQDITEVVRTITWTAQGDGALKATEFVDFDVSVGKLPDSGQMVFAAVQTYDSGEIVRWIEQAAPGAAEPKHPAPVLKLLPKQDAALAAPAAVVGSSGSAADPSGSGLPLVLSIVALLVGAGALAVAMFVRRRGSATPAAPPRA